MCGIERTLTEAVMSRQCQMLPRKLAASCMAAAIVWSGATMAQIPSEDKALILNQPKTEGTASVGIPPVFWEPDSDNPGCMLSEGRIGEIPVDTNVARCRRLCGKIPNGFTFDESRKITGSLSHSGWNAVFNSEWWPDSNTACIHFKNWSDTRTITGTIVVPVRPR